MKRLVIKSKGCMWPTVIWQNSNLNIFYLGEYENDVEVQETHEIDFEKLFLHLDRGDSVFITMIPGLKSTNEEDLTRSTVACSDLRDYL